MSLSGVGFVFDGQPDENGLVYAGADFDSEAFAGEGSIRVAEWVDRFGSYVETGVSGEGLHAITKAHPLASGISHGGIELDTSGRYFAMTGRTMVRPDLLSLLPPCSPCSHKTRSKARAAKRTRMSDPSRCCPAKSRASGKLGAPAKP
jgi:primase-polymerase (primpol)-like protein